MTQKTQISIYLDCDKLEAFRKIAKREDRSIASLIRRMIDRELAQQPKKRLHNNGIL